MAGDPGPHRARQVHAAQPARRAGPAHLGDHRLRRQGPDPAARGAGEPTGNLDEDTRDEIINLLEKLWRERGLTLVLVTHDTAIARRAQRVGVMSKGLLTIQAGTRPDAAADPVTS